MKEEAGKENAWNGDGGEEPGEEEGQGKREEEGWKRERDEEGR